MQVIVVLFIVGGIISTFVGIMAFGAAESVMHEQFAMMNLLSGLVSMGAAFMLEYMMQIKIELRRIREALTPPQTTQGPVNE